MVEELKRTFEFPLIEVVNFDIKTKIATDESGNTWTDDEDWGGGEI